MKRREKWFWIFVGAALLIGFLALIPFNGEICEKADNAGHKECTPHGLPVYVAFKVQTFLDLLGVAITALATIAIAWFTWSLRQSTDKLWDAGENQRKLAERTAEQQLRAYVDIDHSQVTNFGPRTVEIRTVIKNSGQTPAYKVRTTLNVGFDDYPTRTPFDGRESLKVHASTLAPGGFQTSFNEYGPLTPADVAKIVAGEAAIWNWGEVVYEDAFGKTQTSKFRLIYRGKVETEPAGGMSLDEEGNETT